MTIRKKKFWSVCAGTLALLLLTVSILSHSSASAASWAFIDGNGESGINADVSQNAQIPAMVEFNGSLYASWAESFGQTTQIRIKKYDDETNNWMDANNGNPLNYSLGQEAKNPSLAIYNGELYVAWEEVGPMWQIRVKKLSGSSWTSVDGNGANGLNFNPNINARDAKLVVYNNALYLLWDESTGIKTLIWMRKYNNDGATWSLTNGTPLNYDESHAAQYPEAAIWNGKLYATWHEADDNYKYQVRVKAYDGTSWTSADGGGTSGLNVNVGMSGMRPRLAVYGAGSEPSNLYATWVESIDNGSEIRVKKFDGTTWTSADGGDPVKGIATHRQYERDSFARFAVYDGKLYAIWAQNYFSINTIRAKKYDGTSWTSAEPASGNGLNKDATKSSNYGDLVVHSHGGDSGLYAIFLESNGTANQVRVVRMGPDNEAPTASSVSFTGSLKVGNTLTGTYAYADAESDAELGTAFKWYTANDAAGAGKTAIAGATSSTLALTSAQANKYIIFEVTPGAATGTNIGTPVAYTSTAAVAANAAPTASAVSFTGTLKEGNTLTGTYTYADAESDAELATAFKWYTATDAAGTGKTVIAGATSSTLTLTNAQVGKFIIFEVTPGAAAGTASGTATTFTGNSAVAANAAPVVSGVHITGGIKLSQILTGSYAYADLEGDAEGLPIFKWYAADDAAGSNKTAIAGATGIKLELMAAQYRKYITFEVTPVAAAGTLTGTPVESEALGPVGVLKGDANGDGIVTPADALIVNKYVAGKMTLTDEQKLMLDIDDDGDVDANDAKLILNIYNGKGA
ncbi:dockerin type I domain-containing protein [Cohnella sp. GCM10020058]|uniref:dockerin type I domain-containing protein n=1 Tax=Cohnella sp. GCM10020058 TaxID=3317330 RepID=UPI00363F7D52